jgi:hypothetical protein
MYTVRFRHYDVGLGRWLERDPLEYIDGMSLYGYVTGAPLNALDPLGLTSNEWQWHHIIPQQLWEEGEILGDVDRRLMHNAANGMWLRYGDHIMTFSDEYVDFIRDHIQRIRGPITEAKLRRLIEELLSSQKFRHVFERGVRPTANYTARAAKKVERARLTRGMSLVAFLALLGISYEAYAESEQLQELFRQFNSARSHESASWIAQEIVLLLSKLWGSAAAQIYDKLMEAYGEASYQRMLEWMENAPAPGSAGVRSWWPVQPGEEFSPPIDAIETCDN